MSGEESNATGDPVQINFRPDAEHQMSLAPDALPLDSTHARRTRKSISHRGARAAVPHQADLLHASHATQLRTGAHAHRDTQRCVIAVAGRVTMDVSGNDRTVTSSTIRIAAYAFRR
jgi:hypothetical protein